jgi:hypothetical protein
MLSALRQVLIDAVRYIAVVLVLLMVLTQAIKLAF